MEPKTVKKSRSPSTPLSPPPSPRAKQFSDAAPAPKNTPKKPKPALKSPASPASPTSPTAAPADINQTTNFSRGFYFLPLGGSEQFGVNFNLYGCDGKWLIMDCGMGFADEHYPNVDILLPDPGFIEARKKDIVGLVLTHAHEDHIGAVPYLWPRLKCPIYCTKFTAAVLRAKMNEFPKCRDAHIYEVNEDFKIPHDLGPFTLEFLRVPHSVPHSVLTAIHTPYGTAVHSGDWNFDPRPVLDTAFDTAKLDRLSGQNILAYIGDSTNAPIPGLGGSESDVEDNLRQVFDKIEGRILVTIFASNIARIQSIARAAKHVGRRVCLLGRSLHRMVSCAHECGYLKDLPEFIDESDLPSLAASRTVLIVTGSQGEARAALSRISRGDWKNLKLGPKDVAIFSSRAIPGNEKDINQVKNNLSAGGVKVLDPANAGCKIHVSGHPYREEIRRMLTHLRPHAVIPVHGEYMMLESHAELAAECNIPALIPHNGAVICLARSEQQSNADQPLPEIIDHVETKLLAVEPQRIIPANHAAILERKKLQFSGAAHITLLLNRHGLLHGPAHISLLGLIDERDEQECDILDDLHQEIEDTLDDLMDDDITDDIRIMEDVRVACRRYLFQLFGFKPKVTVHLLRV